MTKSSQVTGYHFCFKLSGFHPQRKHKYTHPSTTKPEDCESARYFNKKDPQKLEVTGDFTRFRLRMRPCTNLLPTLLPPRWVAFLLQFSSCFWWPSSHSSTVLLWGARRTVEGKTKVGIVISLCFTWKPPVATLSVTVFPKLQKFSLWLFVLVFFRSRLW